MHVKAIIHTVKLTGGCNGLGNLVEEMTLPLTSNKCETY